MTRMQINLHILALCSEILLFVIKGAKAKIQRFLLAYVTEQAV